MHLPAQSGPNGSAPTVRAGKSAQAPPASSRSGRSGSSLCSSSSGSTASSLSASSQMDQAKKTELNLCTAQPQGPVLMMDIAGHLQQPTTTTATSAIPAQFGGFSPQFVQQLGNFARAAAAQHQQQLQQKQLAQPQQCSPASQLSPELMLALAAVTGSNGFNNAATPPLGSPPVVPSPLQLLAAAGAPAAAPAPAHQPASCMPQQGSSVPKTVTATAQPKVPQQPNNNNNNFHNIPVVAFPQLQHQNINNNIFPAAAWQLQLHQQLTRALQHQTAIHQFYHIQQQLANNNNNLQNANNILKQSPQQQQQQQQPQQLHREKNVAETHNNNNVANGKAATPSKEKGTKSTTKRRSSCHSRGSSTLSLNSQQQQHSPSNGSVGTVPTRSSAGKDAGTDKPEGTAKKKWNSGDEGREVTSGSRRPVPRKQRRVSSTEIVPIASASAPLPVAAAAPLSGSSGSPLVNGCVSADLAKKLANGVGSAAQSFSPSSAQSSESPTGTIASPMEQDGEQRTSFPCLWHDCAQVFGQEEPYVEHINEHVRAEQTPSFFCRWRTCKRRDPFNAQYMLAQHVRKHSGEKPYQCDFVFPDGTRCNKRYSRLENKKTHERTHNGDRPYQCALCKKSFTNASDKAKHQNRTHKETKDFHCPVEYCSKQYTDPSSLRKHVCNEHGDRVWHFAKQNKEEKGAKTYGVNLIGIDRDGQPYLKPQAQQPTSSSDEDREVDVTSTSPPLQGCGGGSGIPPEGAANGWTGGANGQPPAPVMAQQPQQYQQGVSAVQPQQQRQFKQEIASPTSAQPPPPQQQQQGLMCNGAHAEQAMAARLQQLKMDPYGADNRGHRGNSGSRMAQQERSARISRPTSMNMPGPAPKWEYPSPSHPQPNRFVAPQHAQPPQQIVGSTPAENFDFRYQRFPSDLTFASPSPEDPKPTQRRDTTAFYAEEYGRGSGKKWPGVGGHREIGAGGYGAGVDAMVRVDHHHHQMHPHYGYYHPTMVPPPSSSSSTHLGKEYFVDTECQQPPRPQQQQHAAMNGPYGPPYAPQPQQQPIPYAESGGVVPYGYVQQHPRYYCSPSPVMQQQSQQGMMMAVAEQQQPSQLPYHRHNNHHPPPSQQQQQRVQMAQPQQPHHQQQQQQPPPVPPHGIALLNDAEGEEEEEEELDELEEVSSTLNELNMDGR